MDRRTFLLGALATGALATTTLRARAGGADRPPRRKLALPAGFDGALADELLVYAKKQGASYCDIRMVRYLTQSVSARNDVFSGIGDNDSFGLGVRVIHKGTWGFASTSFVTRQNGKAAIDEAIAIALANSKLRTTPLALAPVRAAIDEWRTPIRVNPFEVPLKERADFLLELHGLAMSKAPAGRKIFVDSTMNAVREEKYFASSEGSKLWQEVTRIDPSTWLTAVDSEKGEFASRALYVLPQGRGYEYVIDYPYATEIAEGVDEVVQKLTAKSVEPGAYDLLLHPTHLWLTIHESIGHPTELDRAMGYEANFAGTSFCTPEKLNNYRYGTDIMTVMADRTQEGGLATIGYDDDGVASQAYPIVKNGLFTGFQTTREQASMIGERESRGQSYAQGWWSVPFQRMPNVSLSPGTEKRSLADLIAMTENGILMKGNSSYSIDQQRYNFQFTSQIAYEVKNGKLGPMLRDVAYQSTTPKFWNAMDAICDRSEYMLGGAMYDGKGEPMQANPVSHGCVPARFKGINVINTRSQATPRRTNMLDYNE